MCSQGFGYTPSNFNPATYTAPSGATTDCNATYSSTSHSFTTGSCARARLPRSWRALRSREAHRWTSSYSAASPSRAEGSTLTLTGATKSGDPGRIRHGHDHGKRTGQRGAGATNSTTAGTSGPGGNYNCGSSTGSNPPNSHTNNGGGGGGASGAGGKGAADGSGNVGGNGGAGARQRFGGAAVRWMPGRQQR